MEKSKIMTITFTERVKKHFQFLVDEYGFTISHEEGSDRAPDTEGVVKYSSRTTLVGIEKEAMSGGVGVWFCRLKDAAKRAALSASLIYEYRSLSAKEKAIMLSYHPKDDARARDLVWSKGLPWGTRLDNAETELDRQLSDEARWLRKYADPFLRGDFSRWLELYEYKVAAQKAEYARRHGGKENVGLIMKRGEDGIMRKLGEKTLWQDYLEELRKEYADQKTSGKSGIKKWLEKSFGKK